MSSVNEPTPSGFPHSRLRRLPRNVWAASGCSFLTDVSSEMILNVLPLFLANVLGARMATIGLIEGVAEAMASLIKAPAGVVSDRLGSRKWLAVAGYGLSAASKPFLLLTGGWGTVAAARWGDRVGKGVRTAPRDALVADSIEPQDRGLAFGLHRAADTAGAVLGLLITIAVVAAVQSGAARLELDTFRLLVLASLVPAAMAVVVLAVGTIEPVRRAAGRDATTARGLGGLGRPFLVFLGISALFDLGNSSDAFLVLRAQERGVSVSGVLWLLVIMNVVYTVVSTPAGGLSDQLGRKRLLAVGWGLYALVYAGFAVAGGVVEVGVLYALYGLYYGLTAGTAKALVADLVPAERRGTAFGVYAAVLGIVDLPASLIAGILWQGLGRWHGLGPSAPFWFGAGMAIVATLLLLAPGERESSGG